MAGREGELCVPLCILCCPLDMSVAENGRSFILVEGIFVLKSSMSNAFSLGSLINLNTHTHTLSLLGQTFLVVPPQIKLIAYDTEVIVSGKSPIHFTLQVLSVPEWG